MTAEEIANEIVNQHISTINWDEGDMNKLRKNITKWLKIYAQQEVKNCSIPNVVGQSEQLCQCYQPDNTTAMNCKNCNRSRWEHNL